MIVAKKVSVKMLIETFTKLLEEGVNYVDIHNSPNVFGTGLVIRYNNSYRSDKEDHGSECVNWYDYIV